MQYSLCNDFLNSKKIIYPFLKHGYSYFTEGKTDFLPWAVEIHPTAKCNHRCIHCSYIERNENRAELEEGVFERLIESLIRMKVKGVYFSGGGEPACYRKLPEAIDRLAKHEIEVSMVTNGSLLEKQEIMDVIDKLNYIAVSVPSCTPETFEKITGRNYVEKILALPDIIRSASKGKQPIIGARIVITNIIADEVGFILDTLKSKQYDYALFKVVRDYEDRGLGVAEEKVHYLKEVIRKMSDKGEIDHAFTNLDKIFDYKKPYDSIGICHTNKMGLLAAVTPEGEVYPNISEIGNRDFLIGNLYEHTLEELWNSRNHETVKSNSKKHWISGKCKNCRAISYNEQIERLLSSVPEEEDAFL